MMPIIRSMKPLEKSLPLIGMYPTLEEMVRDKLPLTREQYLEIDQPDADPDEFLGVEAEAQLPEEFRHPDFWKE